MAMIAKNGVKASSQVRAFATEPAVSKKEVLYFLSSKDAESSTAVKSYLKSLYAGAQVEATETDASELIAQLEKKYLSAQVVEPGVHNIALPLGESGSAPVKRYAAELFNLGAQAGFECPFIEVSKKFGQETATSETVKDVLNKTKSYVSADYNAALNEVLSSVEAEINGPVLFDGKTEGFKKFAAKAKAVAVSRGLPADTILAYCAGSANEDAADKVSKEFFTWFESAYTADAAAEVKAIEAEAASILDRHLAKPVAQIRKEQASAYASLLKRAETAKGAKWAEKYLEDVKAVQWFDASVAEAPASGPKVAA